MKGRQVLMIACITLMCAFTLGAANTQDFQTRKIFDNIYAIENPEDGNEQVVIVSEKGLVALNSFWSEITAQLFREGIVEALKRDDFAYLINMVDRLDMFGGNAICKIVFSDCCDFGGDSIEGRQAFLHDNRSDQEGKKDNGR